MVFAISSPGHASSDSASNRDGQPPTGLAYRPIPFTIVNYRSEQPLGFHVRTANELGPPTPVLYFSGHLVDVKAQLNGHHGMTCLMGSGASAEFTLSTLRLS